MQRIGSRAQVMHGNAKMTGGGLRKKDLKYNKQGKIVSKKMSQRAKKEKRLQKAGYTTVKGQFGAVNMDGGMFRKIFKSFRTNDGTRKRSRSRSRSGQHEECIQLAYNVYNEQNENLKINTYNNEKVLDYIINKDFLKDNTSINIYILLKHIQEKKSQFYKDNKLEFNKFIQDFNCTQIKNSIICKQKNLCDWRHVEVHNRTTDTIWKSGCYYKLKDEYDKLIIDINSIGSYCNRIRREGIQKLTFEIKTKINLLIRRIIAKYPNIRSELRKGNNESNHNCTIIKDFLSEKKKELEDKLKESSE